MNHTTKLPRKRGSWFFVVSEGQQVPLAFTGLVTTDGVSRRIVRLAGGCKGLSAELQAGLKDYFVEAFRLADESGATTHEFNGTVFSGGTANFDAQGNLKGLMITNIPGFLAEAYPCIAISTTPRTADMSLDPDNGSVNVDNYGSKLDHRQHGNLVYQKDPGSVLDWDGDLELYLTLMEGWKDAGFNVAIIAMNGGDVTRDEIYGALKRGIPVIVVEGSLREADAFVKAFRDGDFSATAAELRAKKPENAAKADAIAARCKAFLESIDRSLVSIVPIGDAKALREALVARGLLG
jgi:hypothetical protein